MVKSGQGGWENDKNNFAPATVLKKIKFLNTTPLFKKEISAPPTIITSSKSVYYASFIKNAG